MSTPQQLMVAASQFDALDNRQRNLAKIQLLSNRVNPPPRPKTPITDENGNQLTDDQGNLLGA